MRLDRETARLFEYLEEEENKKRKTEEQGSNAEEGGAASSSGAAAKTGEAPRSRGGVPLGTDTSTLEECFKSVFGESAEEVAVPEKRGEAKRETEDDGADSTRARVDVEQRGVQRDSDD